MCSLLSNIAGCFQTSQVVATICSRIFCIFTLPQTNRPQKWQYATFKIGIYVNILSQHAGLDILGQPQCITGVSTTLQISQDQWGLRMQYYGDLFRLVCAFCLWENRIRRRLSHFLWLHFLRLDDKMTKQSILLSYGRLHCLHLHSTGVLCCKWRKHYKWVFHQHSETK